MNAMNLQDLPTRPARPTPDITGTVKTKARPQERGRSSLVLSFKPHEATALRALCGSLQFPNGKTPSMSLIARRSLEVYGAFVEAVLSRPAGRDKERSALTRLASDGAQKSPKP